jgi:putative CocE/NonD family hydrolase
LKSIFTNQLRKAVLHGVVLLLLCASASLARTKTKFDLRIPMRDKVELSADVWMPAAEGRYPTILLRTPYLKTIEPPQVYKWGEFYANHGYVLVVQDVRGRGDSGGTYDFFFPEGKDGYDTVEWIAAQPWSNGRVGMMGGSYLATAGWLAAREHPPHLVCIASTAAPGRWFEHEPYPGGAFGLRFMLRWFFGTSGHISQFPNGGGLNWDEAYLHRPLLTMDDSIGRSMPIFKEVLRRSTLDDYWKRIDFTADDFRKINLPVLHITGWFDAFQSGALSYWNGMEANSPAAANQYLLVGPWTHGDSIYGPDKKVGEMEFSDDAIVDLQQLHLAFFDHFLKQTTASFNFPRARIYVTGVNKWIDEPAYPLPQYKFRSLYFHSAGKANTLNGDGALSWQAPADEAHDTYIFDPRNPVPSELKGGNVGLGNLGLGADHREIERRNDVLVYTGETLSSPLEVIGPVSVSLYAASSARDTDFTAKILDVYPDGRVLKLGSTAAGIIRARYRNGPYRLELLVPNKVELYQIKLFDIAHVFLPGHKVRIEISSSSYPFISPNPNTGNPVATDTEWRSAEQAIYHDSPRASFVSLPTISERETDTARRPSSGKR